jgi:hypothetical protein
MGDKDVLTNYIKDIRNSYNNLYGSINALKNVNDQNDLGLYTVYSYLQKYKTIYDIYDSKEEKLSNTISTLSNEYNTYLTKQTNLENEINNENNKINTLNANIESLHYDSDLLESNDRMKYLLMKNLINPQLDVLDTNVIITNKELSKDLYYYKLLINNQNELLRNKLETMKSKYSTDFQKIFYKLETDNIYNNIYLIINIFLFIAYYILVMILCYFLFTIHNDMYKFQKYGIIVLCIFYPFILSFIFKFIYSNLLSNEIFSYIVSNVTYYYNIVSNYNF